MPFPTKQNIERRRGDTKGIVFVLYQPDAKTVLDISQWTNFRMTLDPSKTPDDDSANVMQMTGGFVTDGTDGRVRFFPDGSTPVGTYYYDAEGVDADSKVCTVAEGKYKIKQDITKEA